jgi:tRNA A64-2'-O-ribosylphosphate transferase
MPDPTGSYYYTQGSGDDEELWSFGLTPEIFWSSKSHETIMSASREALTDAIRGVVEEWQTGERSLSNGDTSAKDRVDDETVLDVQIGATNIFCGRRAAFQGFTAEDKRRYCLLIQADVEPDKKTTEEQKAKAAAILLQLGLTQGKKGLVEFRSKLPQVLRVAKQVSTSSQGSSRILIVEQRPQDLSFAIAAALLSTLYDSSQEFVPADDIEEHCDSLSKEDIRKRLQWVVQAIPNANPSRAHLLRINEVLISNRVKETLRMQDLADDRELSKRLDRQAL